MWTEVNKIPGRDDEHGGLQTDNARVSIKASLEELKEKCKRIGVKIDGGREKIMQRLELVDNKEPDKVDAPTKEKFDANTARTLEILCGALGFSTSGGKPTVIQQLLDYAKSESGKNLHQRCLPVKEYSYNQIIKCISS